MKVFLENKTVIVADNVEEFKAIYPYLFQELRFKNPKVESLSNSNNQEPEYIELYKVIYERLTYELCKTPWNLINKLIQNGFVINHFADNRVVGEPINFKAKFEPRDEQQAESIDKFMQLKLGYGLLNALCAFGKSFSALKILERVGRKTLIIVDQVLIMEQWIDYITEWSDWTEKDIGIIQADNLDIDKGIIIATAQTLYSRPEILEMIKDKIGLTIIDECHVVSAITFQSTIYKLKSKWCLGLSATAERDDGLSFLVTHAVGDVYFTSDRDKMIKAGLIMKPIFRPIFLKRSKHYGNGKKFRNKTEEYRHVLNDFKKDEKVVHVISKIAYHHYKNDDQILMIIKEEDYSWRFYEYILRNFIFTPEQILYYIELNLKKWEEEIQQKIIKINKKKWTDFLNTEEIEKTKKTVKKYGFKNFDVAVKKERREELERNLEINKQNEIEELKKCKREWYMLDEVKKESKVVVIIGKTSKDERQSIIEKAKNKEYKIIITTRILDKAISINSLNILMNVFPSREFANTLQRVGRISRVQKGKTYAISYDFVYWSPTFFSQFYSPNNNHRYKAYKETCEMPDYMSDFIKYGCSTFYGKESNALDKLPFLKQNEKYAFIDLDKI